MKRAVAIIFSWVIAVSLTLYGPLGMATASETGTSFYMEICADGISKTVLVEGDEIPANPSHDCHDCVACSHLLAGALFDASGTYGPYSPMTSAIALVYSDSLYIPTDTIRPMPRGPPPGHIAMQAKSKLIHGGLTDVGFKTHGDGRPPLKDASA